MVLIILNRKANILAFLYITKERTLILFSFCIFLKKNMETLAMFEICRTFAASNEKDDVQHVILGYGVMVTQQILVLFFLVRVRVAQLHFMMRSSRRGYHHSVWAMV